MLKVVVVQPCPGVGAGWVAKQFSTPSSPAYINLWLKKDKSTYL